VPTTSATATNQRADSKMIHLIEENRNVEQIHHRGDADELPNWSLTDNVLSRQLAGLKGLAASITHKSLM
jgi:hypothetical protein